MQIKTHPAMNVLFSRHRTTLNTIHQHIGTAARDLYEEACRQHLLVTGPNYWFYYGMDGKPDTEFTLEIAVPVSGTAENSGQFLFTEHPSFRCLSTVHYGPWSHLSETYAALFNHLQQNNLNPSGIYREAYLNVDFSREENNITEVKIGLK